MASGFSQQSANVHGDTLSGIALQLCRRLVPSVNLPAPGARGVLACDDYLVSGDDPDREGFEAGLRRLAEEVGRSVERLRELDVEVVRAIGVDPERLKELVSSVGGWLNDEAENFAEEAAGWFSGLRTLVNDPETARPSGPHPLDPPTDAQGLALSALASGRWTLEPGSHVLVAHGDGPVPADAVGLVGELRARDWINAAGEVTEVGRNALKRWMDHLETG